MDDQAWQRLLERIAANAPKPGESVDTLRRNLERAAARIPIPEGVAIEPVEDGGVVGEWLRPAGREPQRVLLYLHGGGYVLGSLATHRALVARIALKCRAEVLILDYRLAPESPFPAALEDASNAMTWLRSALPQADVAIIGDSAGGDGGGGLAVATLVALRDKGAELPVAAVAMSPWCDLTLSGASVDLNEASDPQASRWFLAEMADAYLGPEDPATPLASPLYADLVGLPPLLIQVGSAEVLLDDGVRLSEAASAAGVEVEFELWKDMIHVWHALAPLVPQAEDALNRIADWLGPRWSVKP